MKFLTLFGERSPEVRPRLVRPHEHRGHHVPVLLDEHGQRMRVVQMRVPVKTQVEVASRLRAPPEPAVPRRLLRHPLLRAHVRHRVVQLLGLLDEFLDDGVVFVHGVVQVQVHLVLGVGDGLHAFKELVKEWGRDLNEQPKDHLKTVRHCQMGLRKTYTCGTSVKSSKATLSSQQEVH